MDAIPTLHDAHNCCRLVYICGHCWCRLTFAMSRGAHDGDGADGSIAGLAGISYLAGPWGQRRRAGARNSLSKLLRAETAELEATVVCRKSTRCP